MEQHQMEAESDDAKKEADLKARRTARQKKILENAKNRLDKLNGRLKASKDSDEMPTAGRSITRGIYPDPELEQDQFPEYLTRLRSSLTNQYDRNMGPPQQSHYHVPQSNQVQSQNTTDLLNLLQQFSQIPLSGMSRGDVTNTSPQNTAGAATYRLSRAEQLLSKILQMKIHLVVISILTYCLFALNDDRFKLYHVFDTLFLWEFTEMLIIPKSMKPQATGSTMLLSIVLLLGGISQRRANAIARVLETFNKIFKDVGVFMFFFVISHIFYMKFLFDGNEDHAVLVEITQ